MPFPNNVSIAKNDRRIPQNDSHSLTNAQNCRKEKFMRLQIPVPLLYRPSLRTRSKIKIFSAEKITSALRYERHFLGKQQDSANEKKIELENWRGRVKCQKTAKKGLVLTSKSLNYLIWTKKSHFFDSKLALNDKSRNRDNSK